MIRIDGLTNQQVEMLDKLWALDTTDEVLEWLNTLNDEEFRMAVTLQEMLLDAILEEKSENDTELAKKMLNAIGVKC